MKIYILYAMLAGVAWGLGGYFEKAGLQSMKMPPIVGITVRTFVALIILGMISLPAWKNISNPADFKAWLMILIGGGIIAGSLGMWSFYAALSTSENLGVTLAVAFALAPITGTAIGLINGTQKIDLKIAIGLMAIIGGIILIQLAHKTGK
ncbi:EamA family transporter [candidate division KSB1 bacterium]|nr:EamA family transporter [candidate division KSB1 bacterium]MBL7093637.1 EamA family transporter [candidate division KSB1 bacterium]